MIAAATDVSCEPSQPERNSRRRLAPLALAALALPRLRVLNAQIELYGRAWAQSNRAALAAAGPLWVALGDSSAQGVGASAFDAGYVGRLLRRLRAECDRRWRVLNLSRSGARVRDVRERQLAELARLDVAPALVTVAVGGNDLLRSPAWRLERELQELLRRLPEGAVVATLPQDLRTRCVRRLNDVIRTSARERLLLVADVWACTGPPWCGKFAGDGFHSSDRGHADWCAAFCIALELGSR